MSDKPPVPVVLIGCGAVSQSFYLPTLRVLANDGALFVHTLADPTAGARAPLAEAFPQAKQLDDFAATDAPEGSLAIVATPPRFHSTQTLSALARGWNVLCEKPMASDSSDCGAMIAAANEAKRLLAVGLYKRFFPSSGYIKDLIGSGRLGALRSFRIAEGGPFKWPAATASFFNKAQTPGGVLLDIGVHVFDLLVYWLGEPQTLSYADDAMGGLETNARVSLSYANGAEGQIHLSRDWNTSNEYRFIFEGGIVSWKVNDANNIAVQLAGTRAALRAQLVTPLPSVRDGLDPSPLPTNPQSFIAQLQNIVAAIRGEAPLLVPGEEGVHSLRLIEACYRQRSLLDQPWFTPAEKARAREIALNS